MIPSPSRIWMLVAFAAAFTTSADRNVDASVTAIPVPNGSFEHVNTLPVGGVWPEADADPVHTDSWIEPGPVSDDLNAFPPELIPASFAPPEGATLDTGVFYNAQFNLDFATGDSTPNPSFVTNADGDQLAYLFAKDNLEPPIAFIQYLSQVFEPGFAYTLTVGAGKSFFLPPIGGSQADPTLELRLLYRDDSGDTHILAKTAVAVSQVQATTLKDFSATTLPVEPTDPWRQHAIGIAIAPLDGDSGAWIFDQVRLTAIPEPTTFAVMGLIILTHWRRNRTTR